MAPRTCRNRTFSNGLLRADLTWSLPVYDLQGSAGIGDPEGVFCGFRGGGPVAGEAAIAGGRGANAGFDAPAQRDWGEAGAVGGLGGDLHGDAVAGGLLHDGLAGIGVIPHDALEAPA